MNAFIFDSLGTVTNLNLDAVIKCGNQNDFLRHGFEMWKPAKIEGNGIVLGPQQKIYHLRRAAASKDSPKHAWIITVQQKIRPVKQVKGVSVTKMTSCARAQGSMSSHCCVTKKSQGRVNLSATEMR